MVKSDRPEKRDGNPGVRCVCVPNLTTAVVLDSTGFVGIKGEEAENFRSSPWPKEWKNRSELGSEKEQPPKAILFCGGGEPVQLSPKGAHRWSTQPWMHS